MATLPASTRPTSTTPAFPYPAVGFPERISMAATLREELILFKRRRMLDWKSQVTGIIVVAAGSAMIFLAWKSVVAWLA